MEREIRLLVAVKKKISEILTSFITSIVSLEIVFGICQFVRISLSLSQKTAFSNNTWEVQAETGSLYTFAFFISLPIKLRLDDASTLTIKPHFFLLLKHQQMV